MKSFYFLSIVLLTPGITAASLPEHGLKNPSRRNPSPSPSPSAIPSPNWAGAELVPALGTYFVQTSATIKLPAFPATGDPNTGITIGLGCNGALGGISVNSTSQGAVQYRPWTATTNSPPVYFVPSTFDFASGDVIYINVTSFPRASATLSLRNGRTGMGFSQDIAPPTLSPLLRPFGYADFIVADYAGSPITAAGNTLMSFDTIQFTDVSVSAEQMKLPDSQTAVQVDVSSATPLSLQKAWNDASIIAVGSITDAHTISVDNIVGAAIAAVAGTFGIVGAGF